MRISVVRLFEWIWYRPNPVRWVLWPASLLYRLVGWIHARAYASGLLYVTKLSVPVVVVGNITVGGTGKTPCVIWLARELTARGLEVGVVSRGYGGRSATWPQRVVPGSDPFVVGDEPVLVSRLTTCDVAVGPNRAAAAQSLLERSEVDLVLCDDGLQHHALARDIEIAVVDGRRGLGNGLCLPAGPLRESASRLETVDVVLSNDGNWSYPGAVHASVLPDRVYELKGPEERTLEDFAGRAVHAVAGIGNPERFYSMLERAGLVVTRHSHPDHARLTLDDLRFADDLPVLITEKDAVKCGELAVDDVWCVGVATSFRDVDAERILNLVLEAV